MTAIATGVRRTAILSVLCATTLAIARVDAAVITVTTTTDENVADGDCSLREAVLAANGNAAVDACAAGEDEQTDTIVVPAGTYSLALTGNPNDTNLSGDLDIVGNAAAIDLVVTGAGAATTIIQACQVAQEDGNCPAGLGVAERVFHVLDAEVAMSDLTVRHGRDAHSGSGHGLLLQQNFGGAAGLTLTRCVVTANGLADVGASRGGGITNSGGTLTLAESLVSGNVSRTGGGGIWNESATAVLVVTDSTVSGNQTLFGSGGGIGYEFGTVTITNSTVSDNESGFFGGGIFNASGTLALRSTTITANRVTDAGQRGGGLHVSALATDSITIRNTILAGNFDPLPGGMRPDCSIEGGASLTSEGYNIVGDTSSSCPGVTDGVNGDQVGATGAEVDAVLGPLADNGGPTPTHLPLAASPAIDAANPAAPGSGGFACPATDQRGEERPSGAACDVGAVELTGSGVPLRADAIVPAKGGNAGTVQATVLGGGFVDGATVTLVRAGFADVSGTATAIGAHGKALTTSLDLRGVAPGVYDARVANPDASSATLAGAFTVEAGGGSDLWAALVMARAAIQGRFTTVSLHFGNRGTVDAYAVPIWLSFPDELEWHIRFPVLPPPAQPGQIATDWTRIAIDAPVPPPEDRDTFPLLLPVVPAGSTGVLKFRLRAPLAAAPDRLPFGFEADIGTAHYRPELSPAVVAAFVERAKEYAATAHGTTSFPSDAAIAAYVRNQLDAVVSEGRAAAVSAAGGYPPVYSQQQLVIDAGQFIAGESATAATPLDRRWLARLAADLVGGRRAEARIVDADCDPADYVCERETPTCDDDPDECNPDPPDCTEIPKLCDPRFNCDKLVKFGTSDYAFVPCEPEVKQELALTASHDPNDKVGPGRPGGFTDGLTPIPYSVLFENLPAATADAFEVTITDQLDVTTYDLATFTLGPISFGDTFVPVPPGLQSFTTEVDLRSGVNILVGIEAELDTGTGIVTWQFTTLDPATHEFPEDPEDGFLPPNVTSPEGEGAVLFTVSPKPGLALGTEVCNDASIVFDFNAPIDTPEWCNVIGQPEDCENCVDDDGDALVDRADADCQPPANGAGAGLADAAAAKVLDKCAKTVRKAGSKIGSTRLKHLQGCLKAVADCVHLKPGDGKCLAKARAKCAKARTGLPSAEAKITAAIVKACGEPAVAVADLAAAAGLGFDGEVESCGRREVGSLASVAEVAECLRRQEACARERALGAAVPRARELLVRGGFDPASDLVCLDPAADGGGAAIAAEKRKALRKCDLALQKAASAMLAGRAKTARSCGQAVFTCLQTKPGEPACVTKAGEKCGKAFGALAKLTAKFTAAVVKVCGPAPLLPADLLASDGLGMSAVAAECAALGVASLATVADVASCIERQLACRADQLVESETPRLRELLDAAGVALP